MTARSHGCRSTHATTTPQSFWPYVVAALQTVAPGVGEGALALLQPTRPAPIEVVLTALLNDLDALPSDIILLLDDYHVIDSQDVQTAMEFVLDHLPSNLHLVIGSRADPALPLARLRARGELVEIRAAELRFTLDEAAAYLTESMGLVLTAPDVATLEARTEGWIAALQLAALSMQGRDDVTGFIAGFAGDDRYIVDYLVDEVLDRQPEGVRDFLVQTSILDRLSGPLCDAVTGRDDGTSMLKSLDRANLFVVPLDDSRRWYRYHHLFADVLQTHLVGRARRSGQRPAPPREPVVRPARANHRRRFDMRWPLATSTGRPTSSSWRFPSCVATGRTPRFAAGSTSSPTRSFGSGRCSRSVSSER